jgi:dTDP-4-dehydrorhamnose 3,5-epimerase
MRIWSAAIPDVVVVEPARHGDARGFFSEVFRADVLAGYGVAGPWPQDNHSRSPAVGTLRGLHFQAPPAVQGKLVRVTRGAIYDVAVDIRVGSPWFGAFVGEILSAENWRQLWVPPGFAHGFVTLAPDTEVLYKVTGPYDAAADRGIRWDDPALAIPWPVAPSAISEKDRGLPVLRDLPVYFTYGGAA